MKAIFLESRSLAKQKVGVNKKSPGENSRA